jgi:hypothetical protein
MIPTNKTEPKHLGMKETSYARKSHELLEGNQRNHESFHTLGGQILYKTMKKIYAYGARK